MFDVVIVDCPSHTGSVLAAWTLSCADGVFMMSGSHSASVMWNHSFQRAISAIKKKTTYVCAEVNGNFDYRTLHTMLGITPDVWLPHFPNAVTTQIMKRTLYQANGRIGRNYTKNIDKICTMLIGEEDDEE